MHNAASRWAPRGFEVGVSRSIFMGALEARSLHGHLGSERVPLPRSHLVVINHSPIQWLRSASKGKQCSGTR